MHRLPKRLRLATKRLHFVQKRDNSIQRLPATRLLHPNNDEERMGPGRGNVHEGIRGQEGRVPAGAAAGKLHDEKEGTQLVSDARLNTAAAEEETDSPEQKRETAKCCGKES